MRAFIAVLCAIASPAGAEDLKTIHLAPAPETTHVKAPPSEPPAAWFYAQYQIPERAQTVQQQAALAQSHREMDSGYQPYVFCCGDVGDKELISWENRVPLAGELFNKYKLMPGQIINSVIYTEVIAEQRQIETGQLQDSEGDFLDRLQN
jgi:hypothetical protein